LNIWCIAIYHLTIYSYILGKECTLSECNRFTCCMLYGRSCYTDICLEKVFGQVRPNLCNHSSASYSIFCDHTLHLYAKRYTDFSANPSSEIKHGIFLLSFMEFFLFLLLFKHTLLSWTNILGLCKAFWYTGSAFTSFFHHTYFTLA